MADTGEVRCRVRSASFGYAGRALLAGVDVTLRAGEFVAIVGANASGKTTLLRGLIGLLPPISGAVEVDTSRLGYVPQRDTLDALHPVTAGEVVEMGAFARLSALGRLAPADRRDARAQLARVGLAGLERAPLASLSGGQRQRVLVARALLARPRVLALDEPTSGADAAAEAALLDVLAALARDEGLLVLLVAHRFGGLRSSTDDALFVADGRVRRGRLSELDDPAATARVFPGAEAPRP